MSQSRFVLDSNNQWLVGNSDGTISVLDGPDVVYLATPDVTGDVSSWPQVGRIGPNSSASTTHQELELFGVVFSGQKLEELRKNAYDHQVTMNGEGFMVQWLDLGGGGDKGPKEGNLYRRLNDLFDWSRHGVKVPTPVATEWDRYQLGTGELMVAEGLLPGVVEELEMENQTVRDEKDMEIRELKKQLEEKFGRQGSANAEAAKDVMIRTLKDALKLFL